MLGKLIKYDFKALSAKYTLLLIVLAITGIIGSLLTFIKNETFTGILLFLAALFTVGVLVVFFILAVIYLFDTLSGKKSGFTYTLPVKIPYILLSKIINVLIWAAITIITVILFWFIFYKAFTANSQALNDIITSMKNEILFVFGENRFRDFIIILGTDMVFQFIGMVFIIVFCISLTCYPTLKNKNIGVAAGVIGYFVIYYAFSLLIVAILFIFNSQLILSGNDAGADEVFKIIKLVSYVTISGYSILSVVFFFLSSKMFLRHKNV